MSLYDALKVLDKLYWHQCSRGEPTCRLVSGTGDKQRIIVMTELHNEECFVCRREQYGDWDDCPMPANRDDWELVP